MKLKNLLIVNAIVLGGSGISAVLMPSKVLLFYGVELNPAVLMMAQYAGLGSVAIGLVAWFSRNVGDLKAQRTIVLAFLLTYIIAIVISVQGTISGVMKVGWPVVVLYSLLASGYAYFQFMKPVKS
jgi:hypothetical protein